ncbi:hypothetical protein FZI85_17320 [Mycobacterium sp. CBMA293]|uniref:hypothetical protein n=1 Tax=unclassified Mycolicibacterium TaxID=2636767 RepID=UPI0012DE3B5C|nr:MULTISPECIES: hypothetical protein [unclassified Mycolicibacterium]MUL44483.1 hypothetical protein [Mycolicibacterium sp. CBMA 360]MUL59803.1 hypothetical protein [Mycolicibacterium sp. CBMA 335]MUL93963.1 hypothetical protein [Mycolicibacterium sp. CBMA 230]MUM12777.1 hypothetical protein [Mycolicibacterium sp. CBMA 293]MUM32049.1 hypothetical protein [Mycolicibacterium sp. CBMA 361]
MRIKPRPEKAPEVTPEVTPEVEAPEKLTMGEIVGAWFKEESFYRDITTRSLSAALVALVAYLGAVGLGYVGRPPAGAVTALITLAVVFVTQYFALRLVQRGKRLIGITTMAVVTIGVFPLVNELDKRFHIGWHERSWGRWYWVVYAFAVLSGLIQGRLLTKRARSIRERLKTHSNESDHRLATRLARFVLAVRQGD